MNRCFSKKRHTNGHQIYEKVLNIINQGDANKNPKSHLLGQLLSERQKSVNKNVEKKEPLYMVGGNEN